MDDTSTEELPELVPIVEEHPVPVTIITGFLGAGKTTLLNYILKEHHQKRIAVIMNDFEDALDIEKRVSVAKEGELSEEWIELPNGCICCSLRNEGTILLEKLFSRRGNIDYVLLETSGLADPTSMIDMFWQDSRLTCAFRLDGIVTLINAADFDKNHADEHVVAIFEKQIAMADRILLNKSDLVNDSILSELLERLDFINSPAQKLVCSQSIVQLSSILDIQAFDIDTNKMMMNSTICSTKKCLKTLQTLAFSLNGSVRDIRELENWVETLLWDFKIPNTTSSIEIYRLKGLFSTLIPDEFLALQGVRQRYEIEHLKIPSATLDNPSLSKLFVVCKTDPTNELETSLRILLQDSNM